MNLKLFPNRKLKKGLTNLKIVKISGNKAGKLTAISLNSQRLTTRLWQLNGAEHPLRPHFNFYIWQRKKNAKKLNLLIFKWHS